MADLELDDDDTGVIQIREMQKSGMTFPEAMYTRLRHDIHNHNGKNGKVSWKTLLPVIVTLVLAAGGITWSLARTTEKVDDLSEDVTRMGQEVKESSQLIHQNSMKLGRIEGVLSSKQ